MSIEQVKEHLCEIVDECVAKARDLQEKTGFITLERGFAYVFLSFFPSFRLELIVFYSTAPFPSPESTFPSIRATSGPVSCLSAPVRSAPLPSLPSIQSLTFLTLSDLSKKVNPAHFNADLLVGRYIPNLTAVHYEVTKEYAERIHTQTSSPRLEKILKSWDEENWGAAENRNKLGYAILIELLAYQFASPVRWIETQDILFKDFKFERLIELGPSPTLTGMATRTQKYVLSPAPLPSSRP